MKKLILTLLIISTTTICYSQQYKGLGGYLVVNDNVWTLTWQNNNYKILTDWAQISFISKDEVEIFYNDMNSCMVSSDTLTIKREKYTISSIKNSIVLYNNDNQYMTFMKKYAKNGLSEIKESIGYMK
jgi:beta-xylosidase